MKEVAFKLSADCELHQQYMASHEEEAKFIGLVKSFALKHFGTDPMTFRLQKTLYCDKYTPNQVCKEKSNHLYRYKKNSQLQKAWEEEVTSNIDFKRLGGVDSWYLGLIDKGHYSLWSHNGVVYGYLMSKSNEIKLPEGAEPIKMSEYYQVIEEKEQ